MFAQRMRMRGPLLHHQRQLARSTVTYNESARTNLLPCTCDNSAPTATRSCTSASCVSIFRKNWTFHDAVFVSIAKTHTKKDSRNGHFCPTWPPAPLGCWQVNIVKQVIGRLKKNLVSIISWDGSFSSCPHCFCALEPKNVGPDKVVPRHLFHFN